MKSTSYTDAQYLEFYRKLLLPRMIERANADQSKTR